MSAELTNRFAFHRRHPNVSIDAYARQCCIDLGVSLAGRKRIYLDKCFWVHLRDVRLARSQSQSAKDLLELLTHGVSSRALVCPISDTLFLELLKQTDVRSRRATAELIDELSQGVCLAPNQVRVATEVAHMLRAGAGLAVHPLEELVWTKVSNVLGMHHPVNGMFAPAEQLVIQKAFFDHRWTHSLAAIVDTIGESMPTKSSMVDLADRLNIENAEHSDEMRSFFHGRNQ